MRGTFPNPNHMLAPGLFVRVRLPIGEPYRAVMIDEQALGTDQGQKFVYVVDDDSKAQYRRVQVGKLQNGRRVVLKGLKEGEKVVVSGLQLVRPGGEVTAKPAENTAQSESGKADGMAQTETGLDKLSHQ
jgi:RND family efflux transporter MFP subunit